MNGNTKVFPNATIHINKREVDYWFNKSIGRQPRSSRRRLFWPRPARRSSRTLTADSFKTFEDATEFFPDSAQSLLTATLPADRFTFSKTAEKR